MTNLTIIPKEFKPESVQHKIGNWYKANELGADFTDRHGM